MVGLEDKILKAYKELGQIKKVEKLLNISHYRITKILHAHGINPQKKGKRIKPRFYNCLHKWLYNHPGFILPRSPKQIAKLTGCSKDAIKTFLYRRYKQLKLYLKNINKLNPLKVKNKFRDVNGILLTYSMVKQWEVVKVDKYNLSILLKIKLKAVANKNYYIKINIEE